MHYQTMKRHGGNLNEYYWLTQATIKSLHPMIPTVWYSGDSKKISDCLQLRGKEGRAARAQGIFRGRGAVLCDAVGMDHAIRHLSEPTERTPPAVNPILNCGLCITVHFFGCNRCLTLIRDFIAGVLAMFGGQGAHRNFLLPA